MEAILVSLFTRSYAGSPFTEISQDVSGLVHHKMHDNQWTPLPTLPNTDPKRRELHRPSTAATLNMVATAAMSARLWAQYDAAFAQRCLAAARVGYAAAKSIESRYGNLYAPGTDWDLGGGAYNDNDVRDEFYWAAAELFITTGEAEFETDVMNNYYHTANTSTLFPLGGFSWGTVASLGQLNLATVPNNITGRQSIIDSVAAGAQQYMEIQQGQPTGTMMTEYPWGSNSESGLSASRHSILTPCRQRAQLCTSGRYSIRPDWQFIIQRLGS